MRWVNRLLSNNNDMKSQARPRRRIGVKATSIGAMLGEERVFQLLTNRQKWFKVLVNR